MDLLSPTPSTAVPIRLDLGSGPRPKPGFCGVDKIPGIADFMVDFNNSRPWPFANDSVDELRSSHCIEHINAEDAPVWELLLPPDHVPPGLGWYSPYGEIHWVEGRPWAISKRPPMDLLLQFFEQAFRIAKPGAKFEVRCPSAQHVLAYGDPTHRRLISHDLYNYLNRQGRKERGVEFYGVQCNWVGGVQFGSATPKGMVEGSVEHAAWVSNQAALMDREWNIGHELIFNLRAEK